MRLRTTTSRQQSRRYPGLVVGAVAVLALTACTGSAEDAANDDEGSSGSAPAAAEGSNDEEGDQVTIGFSAPAADHGWMAAITNNVRDLAEQYPDIDLQVAEGTNDVNLQISQVETFINDGVDAIVLLPFDGTRAAATPASWSARSPSCPSPPAPAAPRMPLTTKTAAPTRHRPLPPARRGAPACWCGGAVVGGAVVRWFRVQVGAAGVAGCG